MQEDIQETQQWQSTNVNKLESSEIQAYLNSTYLGLFDFDIQSQIKQVKIPYRQNGGDGAMDCRGANGLSCKIFLLSAKEVGFSDIYIPNDGAKLDYFNSGNGTDTKRVAKYNGSASHWWLRSPRTYYTYIVWYVHSDGQININSANGTCGVRPALVLPTDLLVSDDGTVTTNTAPTTPGSIAVPERVTSGQPCTTAWAASTDTEDNLEGYVLERQINGGDWVEVYRGTNLSFTDSIPGSWSLAQYRVCAYDTAGEYSGYASAYVREKNAMTKISTGEDTFYLEPGNWEVSIVKDGETASKSVVCTEYKDYDVNVSFVHIYGVSWDGTSTTKWVRTTPTVCPTTPARRRAAGTPTAWVRSTATLRAYGTTSTKHDVWY